ncbi:hypothetical protein [Planctomyces sp. SH-PL62]|uniref:hypothetical protein n=1 Tax=Planctomyces sp. SH-PL62 TaxID=1636152 RepID=UPI00078D2D92|nr:hypothetical protein [Planctomyces sp. SH-PL62]AMV39962.1 hypothetical protein VT85_21190 [Planctomyces sp. SH-PL62]
MESNFDDPDERLLTEYYGPPQERERKLLAYLADLVERLTEPGLRAMLTTLSGQKDRLLCMKFLAEKDIAGAPLDQLLDPFVPCGLELNIVSQDGSDYIVDVGAGWQTVGDGGRFVLRKDVEEFIVVEGPETWIA